MNDGVFEWTETIKVNWIRVREEHSQEKRKKQMGLAGIGEVRVRFRVENIVGPILIQRERS